MGLLAGSVLDKNGDLVGLVECGVIPCLRKGSVRYESGIGCSDPSIHFSHNS